MDICYLLKDLIHHFPSQPLDFMSKFFLRFLDPLLVTQELHIANPVAQVAILQPFLFKWQYSGPV